ncbi:hypothetical protein [Salmonella enterica]|nr:hypothetical protein [Salmonella enterica]EGZ4524901.1 hypothetical protein [Salmonella enterica subsp. enterica serovar Abaetetuba]EJI6589345.1 hypothetical protein [Salmonella enterica]
MADIVLRSEEDAYALLDKITNTEVALHDINLELDGWPAFRLRLQGEQFNSTITPSVMKAFIEMQSGIYRSYATAVYGSPNTSKLTKRERQMLEMAVKVEPGSSDYSINLQDLLEDVFRELIEKMNSHDALIAFIAFLSFILLCFGGYIYGKRMQNQKEIKMEEIKSKDKKEVLEQMHFNQVQETERMRIMADIVNNNPRVYTINALTQNTQAEVLKRVATADHIDIQGFQLTGRQAEVLSQTIRKPVIDIRLDGMYRLMEVNSSVADGFKLRVENCANGDKFSALVQNDSLDSEFKNALQNAEWGKMPVELIINAKQRTSDYSIFAAKIVKAVFRPEMSSEEDH